MRVLVTGANGYTGAHVCVALAERGHEAVALLRPSSDPALLDALAPGATRAVFEDGPSLQDVFAETRPQVVCHLAARYPGGGKQVDAADLIAANVTFGTQVAEAAVAAGCGLLVTAGTYWQHLGGAQEHANCLYAATKTAFRSICDFFHSQRGLACVELRLFDSYGPADPRTKLMSLLDDVVATGRPLDMTRGEQLLYPIHIADTASAFVHAVEKGVDAWGDRSAPPSFAVPGPQALSVREMVDIYSAVRGRPVPVNWGARDYDPGQIMQPHVGETLPGWRAGIGFAEGLRMVYGPRED